MTRVLGLAVALLGLSAGGCASVVNGRYQSVEFTSEPQGARVTVDPGGHTTVTPGTLDLPRKRFHTAHFELPGYETGAAYVDRYGSDWVILDVLCGICLPFDVWIGGVYRLQPREVHVELAPDSPL